MADADAATERAPIQFAEPDAAAAPSDAPPAPPLTEAALAELEEERERHRAR